MEKIESGEGWYWGSRKRGSFWVASVMYVILISQVMLQDEVSSPQVTVLLSKEKVHTATFISSHLSHPHTHPPSPHRLFSRSPRRLSLFSFASQKISATLHQEAELLPFTNQETEKIILQITHSKKVCEGVCASVCVNAPFIFLSPCSGGGLVLALALPLQDAEALPPVVLYIGREENPPGLLRLRGGGGGKGHGPPIRRKKRNISPPPAPKR